MADLKYSIATERLTGSIGQAFFDIHAVSGGRGGSTTPGAVNWWLKNNALATHVRALAGSSSHAYGPLPVGEYRIARHPHHVHWLRLLPLRANIMHGRSGFAIHSRGPTGSHGCIVPENAYDVERLLSAVARHHEKESADPTLEVVAEGFDLDLKYRTA